MPLLGAGFARHSLRVLTNPISIFRKDPGADVFIDGKPIDFERGVYRLCGWKRSYRIVVQSSRGTVSRRIYPWDDLSDSGSVHIDRKGVEFYVKSVVEQ